MQRTYSPLACGFAHDIQQPQQMTGCAAIIAIERCCRSGGWEPESRPGSHVRRDRELREQNASPFREDVSVRSLFLLPGRGNGEIITPLYRQHKRTFL